MSMFSAPVEAINAALSEALASGRVSEGDLQKLPDLAEMPADGIRNVFQEMLPHLTDMINQTLDSLQSPDGLEAIETVEAVEAVDIIDADIVEAQPAGARDPEVIQAEMEKAQDMMDGVQHILERQHDVSESAIQSLHGYDDHIQSGAEAQAPLQAHDAGASAGDSHVADTAADPVDTTTADA